MQSLCELVICMSGAALNDDIDVVGGTHAMQVAVGDEERHHLSCRRAEPLPEIVSGKLSFARAPGA